MAKADERLDENGRAKLRGLLRAGDPGARSRPPGTRQESARELYTHTDPVLTLEWAARLGHDLRDADCPPEVRRLGRTLVRWHRRIAAWHGTHVSNGPPRR